MTSDDGDENIDTVREMQESPFFNTEQAAYYLGCSPRTLQTYRRTGVGPRFRRHGRHLRYHIDDLEAWSQGRRGGRRP